MIEPYTAVAVQTIIRQVRETAWRDAVIRENVNRYLSLMDYVKHRWGSARLFVMPEFSLTGSDHVRSVEEWTRVAHRIPGPEIEPFANFARHNDAYVAGGTMEYDPNYPGRWFNSAFLFDPKGELILRYRKVNDADVTGVSGVRFELDQVHSTVSALFYNAIEVSLDDGATYEVLFQLRDPPNGFSTIRRPVRPRRQIPKTI